jgi:hypothetical protein
MPNLFGTAPNADMARNGQLGRESFAMINKIRRDQASAQYSAFSCLHHHGPGSDGAR